MLSYAPAPPATRGAYKWWVVFMLWFICFFNYADRQVIFAVFSKLKEEFGFDKVQLGLFVGLASKCGGKPTEIENMSNAIAVGGVVYLVAAGLVLSGMLLFAKDSK